MSFFYFFSCFSLYNAKEKNGINIDHQETTLSLSSIFILETKRKIAVLIEQKIKYISKRNTIINSVVHILALGSNVSKDTGEYAKGI